MFVKLQRKYLFKELRELIESFLRNLIIHFRRFLYFLMKKFNWILKITINKCYKTAHLTTIPCSLHVEENSLFKPKIKDPPSNLSPLFFPFFPSLFHFPFEKKKNENIILINVELYFFSFFSRFKIKGVFFHFPFFIMIHLNRYKKLNIFKNYSSIHLLHQFLQIINFSKDLKKKRKNSKAFSKGNITKILKL